jgi:hypothetical protein
VAGCCLPQGDEDCKAGPLIAALWEARPRADVVEALAWSLSGVGGCVLVMSDQGCAGTAGRVRGCVVLLCVGKVGGDRGGLGGT